MLDRVRLFLELFVFLEGRCEDLLASATLLLTVELTCSQTTPIDVLSEVSLEVGSDPMIESFSNLELILVVLLDTVLFCRLAPAELRIESLSEVGNGLAVLIFSHRCF